MENIILIVQAKDKMIDKLQQTIREQDIKLAQKDQIIQAQKQALDFLWDLAKDKQFQLDRHKEHSKQMKLKL